MENLEDIIKVVLSLYGAFVSYKYYKLVKRINTKTDMLAKISLDYVKSNRKAQEYQRRYDDLLTKYAKEIGFKNEKSL